MKIDLSVIKCDCGSPVHGMGDGKFTCTNPSCKNFEVVFRAPEIVAVPTGKNYRETLNPESVMPAKAELFDRQKQSFPPMLNPAPPRHAQPPIFRSDKKGRA